MSLLAEAIEENFKKPVDENMEPEGTIVEQLKKSNEQPVDDSVVETPIVEEPIVEPTAEFVSDEVNSEEIVSEETTENKATEQIPTEFIIEEEKPIDVSKYTDGEFNSIDELVASYKSLKDNVVDGTTVLESLDKQSEEQFGLSYSELVSFKNTDYDNMNDFDVLSEYEEMKDPDVTQIEIDAELEQFTILSKTKKELDTMIEDGDLTAKDLKMLEAKFSKAVRTAKGELNKFKESLSLDGIKIGNAPQKENIVKAPTQEEVAAQKESMKEDLKSFSKLRINLGDKGVEQNFDFEVTDNDKGNLVDTVSNPNWVGDRWKNEDGSWNKNKAYRDAYVLTNYNKMIKAAYSEGIVKGSKNHVVNEDNITLSGGKQINQNQAVDPLQALADKMGQHL